MENTIRHQSKKSQQTQEDKPELELKELRENRKQNLDKKKGKTAVRQETGKLEPKNCGYHHNMKQM